MQTISFRDLFDHIGTERMSFSKRAEALSGVAVELRGYLVAMHATRGRSRSRAKPASAPIALKDR